MIRPVTLTTIIALTVAVGHAADVSRQQADVFQEKIMRIAMSDSRPAGAGDRRTPVSETEVNSWFTYHGQPLLPAGVSQPNVTILGEGRVTARAIVDVDALAKKRASGSMLDPWSYLGGKMPVAVTGILHSRDGVARFELEAADVSGVPVPKSLLQELVAYYSRSEEHPRGISLDDPFELPAGIRRIEVGRGQAVVVQ